MRKWRACAAFGLIAVSLGQTACAPRTTGSKLGGELALMPLPKAQLGPAASRLPLAKGSGAYRGNLKLRTIEGYQLDYNGENKVTLQARHRLLRVETNVSLYKSHEDALRGLRTVGTALRAVATKKVADVKIISGPIPTPKVGTARFAFGATLVRSGYPRQSVSVIAFVRGEIVAVVLVESAGMGMAPPIVRTLARRFRARIEAVIAGKITAPPLALPAKAAATRPGGEHNSGTSRTVADRATSPSVPDTTEEIRAARSGTIDSRHRSQIRPGRGLVSA